MLACNLVKLENTHNILFKKFILQFRKAGICNNRNTCYDSKKIRSHYSRIPWRQIKIPKKTAYLLKWKIVSAITLAEIKL